MLGDNHFARDNGPLSDRCPLSDPRPFPYDSALNATILIDHSLFKQYRFPYHRTTLHLDLRRKNRVRSHFGAPRNDTTTTHVGRLLDIEAGRDIFPRIRQQLLASFQQVHVHRHVILDLSNIIPETIMPPSPKLHPTRQDWEDFPFKAYRLSFWNHSDHTMVQDVNSRVYPSRTLSFLRFLLETYDLIARVQCDQSEGPRVYYREDCNRGFGTARHMGPGQTLQVDIAHDISVDNNHRFVTGHHARCQSQGSPGSQRGLLDGQRHPIPHLPGRHVHAKLVRKMINRKYHFPYIPPVEPVRHVVYQRRANDRKQELRLRTTERPKPRREPSGENQSLQRLFQALSSRIRGRNVVIAFTRERADEFLSPSSSRKRLGQKGVDAIFSSSRQHRPATLLVGVLGIVTGVTFWITVLLDREYTRFLGPSETDSYLTLSLTSIGLILVLIGAGICTVPSVSIAPTEEKALEGYTELAKPSTRTLPTSDVRRTLFAFIQSSIIAALYIGLVEEYQSNLSMQHWVRLVFPTAKYILNWETVLVLSTLLGLITTQFLPGRLLAERKKII